MLPIPAETSPCSRPVAERIRDEILRGTYQAGQRLPGERDLAARLGVHRGAIREALKVLEQIGLVATHPGGTTVCPLHDASIEIVRHLLFVDGVANPALVGQLLDVHEMLVAGAARLAVERGSEDELLHARELVGRLGDASLAPAELPRLLDEIVDLITTASGNLVLRLCRNTIRAALSGRLQEIQALLRPQSARRAERVEAIERAIAARDPVATEEAVRVLLRDRRELMMAALEADDPRAH